MQNFRGLKCGFWNKVPIIEMALSPLNINQFSKLRPFLKSEFCGPHKNDKNTYAMCFGGPEIVKKKKWPKY